MLRFELGVMVTFIVVKAVRVTKAIVVVVTMAGVQDGILGGLG
jgi:hypothetical protein